jgi:hypothetical protein
VIKYRYRSTRNGVSPILLTFSVVIMLVLMGATASAGRAAQNNKPNVVNAPATSVSLAKQSQSNNARFGVHATVLALLMCGVLLGIALARKGHALPIREIAGLDALEEAVARATEMGRPALFTTGGVCDIRRVQLYASMPLLRRVAGLSGELGNRLVVPVAYAETLSVHTNAVRDGYADVAALEEYRPGDIRFFPGGQFFFAMATMGWMLKEQPAACFYFGWWEADSLMLAETGQTIGALQIAGTDQLPQIPFFVVACDYTIIGEEFWAASAKMSRDPGLLGSFGAQDLFKLLIVTAIVVGVLLSQHDGFARWLDSVRNIFG